MNYFPGQEDEDELMEGPAPSDTIAGPQTTRDQVMQRIASVRNASGDEGESLQQDTQRDAAMQFAQSNALTSGMGRALNTLASGTGFKPDDSGYDAMDKQSRIVMMDLDRSNMVRKAIEDRKAKMAAASGMLQERSLNNRRLDARDAEAARHNRAMEGMAGQKVDKKSEPQRLPPDKVLNVNEGNVIPQQLSDVRKTLDANQDSFGPVMGRLNSLNPYDEKSSTIDAQMRAAAQSFGKYMEGGVLRKEDEDKYRKMFPNLSDTPEVARNKLAIVDRLLSSRQGSNVAALKTSGYDVSGVDQGLSVPDAPGILTLGKPGGSGLIPEAHAGGGRVIVSNGKETHSIELSDLPDAMKDGFQVVRK